MKELLARINAIQRLLVEESQLQSVMPSQPRVFMGVPNLEYFKARTRLMQIKALLKNYSENEIELAKRWDRLKEEYYESACRRSGMLPIKTPKQKPNEDDDFWHVLLFIYLLATNRLVQAFLSRSLGIGTLFFADEGTKHQAPVSRKNKM